MNWGLAVVLCAAVASGCSGPSPSASASATPSAASTVAINPALLGQWEAYDNDSHKVLGTLDIKRDKLIFAKGLTLQIVPVSSSLARVDPADGAKPVWGKDGLCGPVPVLSVSFTLPSPKELRLSIHDVASGPGSDPDFDLHRCQTFTFVRD